MNFDGFAIVNESKIPYIYKSINDNAFISSRHIYEKYKNLSNFVKIETVTVKRAHKHVFMQKMFPGATVYVKDVHNGYSINTCTPYEYIKNLKYTVIHNGCVIKNKAQDDITYKGVNTAYPYNIVSSLTQYNPVTTLVINHEEEKQKTKDFSSFSVNVTTKQEIIVPEGTGYQNISVVIQKNCFVEFNFGSSNIIEIINIPDGLEYTLGFLKGIITKSGDYNVRIKYPDGEQILNIIVPYYQRLL